MSENDFICEDDCEKEMLTIERKRFYEKEEQIRPEFYNNILLVNFATNCIDYTEKYNDLRYLNLALKINDSNLIDCDKAKLNDLLLNSVNKLRLKLVS
jgi:hypothetical protein